MKGFCLKMIGNLSLVGVYLSQVTGDSEASTWGCSMPPTRARLSPLPFLARYLGSSPHPWSGPCSGQREVEGAKYRKGHICLVFCFFFSFIEVTQTSMDVPPANLYLYLLAWMPLVTLLWRVTESKGLVGLEAGTSRIPPKC